MSNNNEWTEKEKCHATGKVCYTQREANEVIRLFKKRSFKCHSTNIPQRSYVCQFCGNYHLTHFRKKNSTKRFSKSRMKR